MLPFLPDDIFTGILPHLDPDDILDSIIPASRRLQEIASNPLYWREACLSRFVCFNEEHELQKLLKRPPHSVDWLALYRLRRRRNAHTLHLLNEMTSSSEPQYDKLNTVIDYDYDVKDFLVAQCHTDPFQGNGLSRAYWADRALGAIHRRRAIKTWLELRDPTLGPAGFCRPSPEHAARGMERGVAAFDMFVLCDSWCDIDLISLKLDDMASAFRTCTPGLNEMSTRGKALALNVWLRQQGFIGLTDPAAYRNFRNCLIGQALTNPAHETIPITSTTLYCAIAKRVDLDASAWLGLGHVLVCVPPQAGRTLDGTVATSNADSEPMFLDPWRNNDEVPLDLIEMQIRPERWYRSPGQTFTHPVEIVMRVYNNIQASIEVPEHMMNVWVLRAGHRGLIEAAAGYAARWADLVFDQPQKLATLIRGDFEVDQVHILLGRDVPWEDVIWAQDYLRPLSDFLPASCSPHQLPPSRRNDDSATYYAEEADAEGSPGSADAIEPRFVPGQLIALSCSGDAEPRLIMPIRSHRDKFRRRMAPHDYKCLNSSAYEGVASDQDGECELVLNPQWDVLSKFIPHAGQYFSRFDRETSRFIEVKEAN